MKISFYNFLGKYGHIEKHVFFANNYIFWQILENCESLKGIRTKFRLLFFMFSDTSSKRKSY